MERREKASAAREDREYVPVRERGAVVHAARQAREAFRDMHERLDAVLNKPRERLDNEDARERELEKEWKIEKARELDRGPTHGL